MRFTAMIAALALCRVALAGDPMGPESLLPVSDGRDAYTPAAGGGSNLFLVAWQSGRMADGDLTKGLNPIGDIVACRVDKEGRELDAKPLVISAAKDIQEQPQIAFAQQGGGVFLVVWQDLRNERDWDVYAARVTPDSAREGQAAVLDPNGILVAGGVHNQALPQVAWDGRAFQVCWQDYRSGEFYEVYGGRVSVEGKALDGRGVLLASGAKAGYNSHAPVVASSGGGRSFVLWVAKGDSVMYYKNPDAGGLFVSDGIPVDGSLLTYKEKGHGPGWNANPVAIAAGGAGYMAAWRTDYTAGRGGSPTGSTGAIFDAEGKRVKSLFLAGRPQRIDAPQVCWDGSAYVAAWQENGQKQGQPFPYDVVLASRISDVGDLVGAPFAVSGTPESPAREAAVASDGLGATLIAYEKHPATGDVPIRVGFRMLARK